MSPCEHLEAANRGRRLPVRPSSAGCKECLQLGDPWVHLRLCLTCGHVGCCDASPNRHATQHAHRTTHPVVRSYEPGEEWAYCYTDDAVGEPVQSYPSELPPRHFSPPAHPA